MATHTDSRQRNGVLTLDAIEFACQQRNVRLIPPAQSDDALEEVLDGTSLAEDEERPWMLGFTAIQDFSNAAGLQKFSWDNSGEIVAFSWQPQGPTGPTYAGTVQVYFLEVGGAVKSRLEVEATWKVQGVPSWTPAA